MQKTQAEKQDPITRDEVQIGDVVAVKDQEDSKEFWLAEVTGVDAEDYDLHYYGTTSKKKKGATFKPAHIGRRTGMTILAANPKQRDGEKTLPWTGKSDPELVICKVALLPPAKNGARRLAAKSLAALKNFTMARL